MTDARPAVLTARVPVAPARARSAKWQPRLAFLGALAIGYVLGERCAK